MVGVRKGGIEGGVPRATAHVEPCYLTSPPSLSHPSSRHRPWSPRRRTAPTASGSAAVWKPSSAPPRRTERSFSWPVGGRKGGPRPCSPS